MPETNYQIRFARIEYAMQIGKVHVDSWRTTYKDIFSESFLAILSYEKRTAAAVAEN